MTNLMKRLGSVFLAVFVACSGMLAFGVPAKAEASDPFIVYLQAGTVPLPWETETFRATSRNRR